ncbi:MAG: serine hydrolase [Flexilinea sp.]
MNKNEIQAVCETLNGGEYAFYFSDNKGTPVFFSNQTLSHRFLTASVIKVPILYVWTILETQGFVSSDEICDFADEPLVKGSGFSYLFRTRKLTYNDVLIMMIATSDNYCTNMVIGRLRMDTINRVFKDELKFSDTHIGRKMMHAPDPATGMDNWTTAADMIHCFDLYEAFSPKEKEFISQKLLACEAAKLFLRNVKGDTLDFYHKSGGLSNVINEWGFTLDKQIFLLTNNIPDYQKAYDAFGVLGKLML